MVRPQEPQAEPGPAGNTLVADEWNGGAPSAAVSLATMVAGLP